MRGIDNIPDQKKKKKLKTILSPGINISKDTNFHHFFNGNRYTHVCIFIKLYAFDLQIRSNAFP